MTTGEINLPVILLAAFVSSASPGPATLTIAGTSMDRGYRYGLAVAAGVTTGSWLWSIAAALGLGTIMLANAWIFETARIIGALYLLLLAMKSARAALSSAKQMTQQSVRGSLRIAYGKGLALHLTNPKPILFFGALYGIGVPTHTSFALLAVIIGAVGLQSLIIFHGYALLFANRTVMVWYVRLQRWFEAAFAIAFGAAALKVFSTRLGEAAP
jgi:threonine/homoserine/homoserine lactone efflux protein